MTLQLVMLDSDVLSLRGVPPEVKTLEGCTEKEKEYVTKMKGKAGRAKIALPVSRTGTSTLGSSKMLNKKNLA